MEEQLDRKDLKIQALKERLAEITVQFEDRDADRRIDITILSQRVQELESHLEQAEHVKDNDAVEKSPTD